MTHEIKPVPWEAHKRGTSSSPARVASGQPPHGRLAWISATALVVGLIVSGLWSDDWYCQENPDAGPDMHVDRLCYEILAESSTWRAVMGEIGFWLILGSIVGFLVALWWYLRHHLRGR
ncbi:MULTISPECIES: hypothetical protein [unclassified Streptomyces]|uniref:hypothetical protein n=1 Tax=unclassified Streptomyces TaxID=2593676 RepID=UPI0036FBFFDB